MKFHVSSAVAIALFCQALFAKDPTPLAKSQTGERTNHPVLFVSGLGSNASGTWGAKGREVYCEEPELLENIAPKVVSYEWTNTRLLKMPVIGKVYEGHFKPTIAYPYHCSNMSKPHYDGKITLQPLNIVYRRNSDQDSLRAERPQPYVLGKVYLLLG